MSLRSILVVLALLVPRLAAAQVVIQQPVVEVNNVNTAVSVPDRGSALLGSVSRATDGRSDYGPLPYGTSTGRGIGRSSTNVTVTIHDFESMDQIMLERAMLHDSRVRWENPIARFAWESERTGNVSLMGTLRKHYSQPTNDYDPQAPAAQPATSTPVVETPPVETVTTTEARLAVPRRGNTQMDRLLTLGDRALANDNIGNALSFYRGAANLGSKEAEEKIQQILDAKR